MKVRVPLSVDHCNRAADVEARCLCYYLAVCLQKLFSPNSKPYVQSMPDNFKLHIVIVCCMKISLKIRRGLTVHWNN